MRALALTTLAAGMLLAMAPASAQTYGAGYPVCLHVYGPATYYDCSYSSLAQCNATASGRAASCVVSPYAANAAMDRPPFAARRHYYRGY
jgi:hypothetical protein